MVLDLNKKGPAIDLQDTSLLTRPISVKVKMRVKSWFPKTTREPYKLVSVCISY